MYRKRQKSLWVFTDQLYLHHFYLLRTPKLSFHRTCVLSPVWKRLATAADLSPVPCPWFVIFATSLTASLTKLLSLIVEFRRFFSALSTASPASSPAFRFFSFLILARECRRPCAFSRSSRSCNAGMADSGGLIGIMFSFVYASPH